MPSSHAPPRSSSPSSADSPKAVTARDPASAEPAGIGRDVPAQRGDRLAGLDIARGLAVVLMLQTHAYDGWVSATEKVGLGYAVSRLLANIPAPMFLLLAGIGLSLGAHAAAGRGQADPQIRRQLLRRGLEVAGYGYLVSALYAVIEWPVPVADLAPLLLRADILHCIGLSLALCSVLLVRRPRLPWRVTALVVGGLLASLLVGRVVPQPTSGLWAPLLGLLYDIPGYTRFPLLPLVGFCGLGVLLGEWLRHQPPGRRPLLLWLAGALALVLLCGLLTRFTLQLLGGTLRRSHPAVVWNFGDGAGRAIATLTLGLWLARAMPAESPLMRLLARLGTGSLLAYAVHIPFCYGRLAQPLSGRLSMPLASVCLVALLAFVLCVLALRDALRYRLRSVGRRAPHSP